MPGRSGFDTDDTIAAIASPPGPAPRGIVRLAGPEAVPIAMAAFTPEPVPTRRPSRRCGTLQVDGLRPALPASLLIWPNARSYTGQPSVEIHMVGSPPLLQLVLAHLLSRGARLANPGEFTLRAFLSGRIDLTRAETVLGVIDATRASQVEAALKQLAGGLAGPITLLRDRLLDVVAHLEAGLDFVDEDDVDPIARASLAAELHAAAHEVADLAARLDARDRPEGRPRVVLAGPPNAGKSRLFNALVGTDHALVSPVAGTTRDYLVAPCDCEGLFVDLIDTAGAETARDDLDASAQRHRAEQIEVADLVLSCRAADDNDGIVAPTPSSPDGPIRLDIATRCDLAPAPAGRLATSAVTGTGLDALRQAIADALERPADGEAVASTSARCRGSLADAARSLADAAHALESGAGEELVAIDLRQALDDLGHVVGAVVTDDILDRIFSRFCIGK